MKKKRDNLKTYEEQVYFKFTNSLEYKADSWSLKYVNKY